MQPLNPTYLLHFTFNMTLRPTLNKRGITEKNGMVIKTLDDISENGKIVVILFNK